MHKKNTPPQCGFFSLHLLLLDAFEVAPNEMQKGREVDSTPAPRTGENRRVRRGIVFHGAVHGRAMRFGQGLLKAVPLLGVLQREAWKQSKAAWKAWTQTEHVRLNQVASKEGHLQELPP